MPEFSAPVFGRESNLVNVEVDVGENASGVLYALGGASGGLTLYMDKGRLVYEYNMMIIERYITKSRGKLAPGKHEIEVDTTIARPGAPGRHGPERGWRGSRPYNGEADRARRIHCQRDV